MVTMLLTPFALLSEFLFFVFILFLCNLCNVVNC